MREIHGVRVPDDDEYAFPMHAEIQSPEGGVVRITSPGMTLRDWFAGQVAAGIMANQRTAGGPADFANTTARMAYSVADALMHARGGK